MRKALLVTAVSALGVVSALAGTAYAGDTTTTFTLSGGSIAISVPTGTVNIATATVGAASVSGSLGNVVVTDTRGALVAAWTATVSSTDFTTGGGSANEKVLKSAIAYSSGAGTASVGQVGAMVPSVALSLGSAQTAATWAGVGNNTVTWNPTLLVTLSASQVAGVYTGTITHSVA